MEALASAMGPPLLLPSEAPGAGGALLRRPTPLYAPVTLSRLTSIVRYGSLPPPPTPTAARPPPPGAAAAPPAAAPPGIIWPPPVMGTPPTGGAPLTGASSSLAARRAGSTPRPPSASVAAALGRHRSSVDAAGQPVWPAPSLDIDFASEVVLLAKLGSGGFGQARGARAPSLRSLRARCRRLTAAAPPKQNARQVYSGIWRGLPVAVKLVPALEAWAPEGGGPEAAGGAEDGGAAASTAAGGGGGLVSASAASILQEVQARPREPSLSQLSAPDRCAARRQAAVSLPPNTRSPAASRSTHPNRCCPRCATRA